MAGGRLFEIRGADAGKFLQGLVTNDLAGLEAGPVYAALLSPQGKYLADFFLLRRGDSILLDIAPALAEATMRRLNLYRLRAVVEIDASPLAVTPTFSAEGAVADPRHPALGFRRYAPGPAGPDAIPAGQATALRVAHCVPESGIELIPDESYILECGFERLHGVSFRKGCYVGQEVTARMKHKTDLRKGLVRVAVEGPPPPPGTALLTAEGKAAGQLFTCAQGAGLAHLRFDRARGAVLRACDASVRWDGSQPE